MIYLGPVWLARSITGSYRHPPLAGRRYTLKRDRMNYGHHRHALEGRTQGRRYCRDCSEALQHGELPRQLYRRRCRSPVCGSATECRPRARHQPQNHRCDRKRARQPRRRPFRRRKTSRSIGRQTHLRQFGPVRRSESRRFPGLRGGSSRECSATSRMDCA